MRLLLAIALCALSFGATADGVDDFFKEYAARRDNIEVLEGTFTQKNILPDEVTKTYGTLLYARPRRIVLRTQEPETVTLVDDKRLFDYDAELEQLVMYDLAADAGADVYFMCFDENTDALRRDYNVSTLERKDQPNGKRGILIQPKASDTDSAPFQELRVYLRDEDLLPYEIQIVNDADSSVYIYITDLKVNGKPAPEATQIHVPEGTSIIENDEFQRKAGPGGEYLPEALTFGKQDKPAPASSAPLRVDNL